MTGLLIGLLTSAGAILLTAWFTDTSLRLFASGSDSTGGWRDRTDDALVRSGVQGVTVGKVVVVSAVAAFVVFVLLLGISRSLVIAIAFGLLAGSAPSAWIRRRARPASALWSGYRRPGRTVRVFGRGPADRRHRPRG